jgi:hypothetical protein
MSITLLFKTDWTESRTSVNVELWTPQRSDSVTR